MEVSELVRTFLAKRGVVEDHAISEFLEPDYDLHTHSPLLLEGMERAVVRLLSAMARNERIAVYADFDCDGIPGAALLSDFFKKIGYENFEVYLPHRDREGYGFHIEAIDALAKRGVTLIITVDVGTTALKAVAFAKERGVDVIVTDHHEITGALPEAIAIINPKLANYPFRDLCGAAVAFKLVQAALAEGRRRELKNFVAAPEGWEKWLLDLVAIATVADLVPLVGENRVLTHFGLRVLRKSQRPGIAALCERLRLRRSELTESDIAFSVAPRINAASRMDEPDLALKLLTTGDAEEAGRLAAHLEELNAERKGVVAGIVRQARRSVGQRFSPEEKMVVLGDPEWKPALLGLAANSLMDARGGMVCLWGRDATGKLKGSCRSDGSVSVVGVFSRAAHAFIEYGGHEHSGGFTVSHEAVHTLPEILSRAASENAPAAVGASESGHDRIVTLSEVSWGLFQDVSLLAPFGVGNPKPLFRIARALVTDVRRFGKEKNHLELMLECRETGARARAFDFFRAPEDLSHAPASGTEAAVLATLERDSYRGGLALRIADVMVA